MAEKPSVLVVEDDASIRNFILALLSSNGYRPLYAESGTEALALAASHCPDVLLLDLGLPDMDGLDVLTKVREWSGMPVIVVSARGLEREKVKALDMGADDYVTKPFGTSELLARIRTALRHARKTLNGDDRTCFVSGDLSIDFVRRLVRVGEREVHLTPIEYKIVALLSEQAGRVLTYDTIIRQIWGPHAPRENQILRVNMANIRRKLEINPAEPQYILTEVGVGYRMVEEA